MTYLFALVNIALLIIVHEFGHMVVAKWCGVSVPVFSIGFGRRLVGFEYGGTDYRLSSIPFGGYVRMAGSDPYGYFEEDEFLEDPSRGFLQRPLWQRIAILLAGPGANVLFAIAIICTVLVIGDDHPIAEVGLVRPDSPAEQAGFESGDEIKQVGGVEVETWNQAMSALARLTPGTTEVDVLRDGEPRLLAVVVDDGSAAEEGPVRTTLDFGLRNARPVPLVGMDDPASPAGVAGVQTGWLVKQVGETEVRDWVSMNRAFRELGDAMSVELTVGIPDLKREQWEDKTVQLERSAWRPPDELGLDEAASWGLYPSVLFVQRVSDTVSDSYGFLSACRPAAPPRDSPARLAGVATGDHLVAIDGRPLLEWADVDVGVRSTLSPDAAPSEPPRPLALAVRRDGELVVFEIQPEVIADQDNTGMNQVRAIIGVGGAGYAITGPTKPIPYPVGDALVMSVEQNVEMARMSVERIGHLIVGAAAFDQSLGGPVAMFTTGAIAAEAGLFSMAKFAAAISLSLGVVNLFPIPVLDGGQILFFLIEAIRGRPLSAAMRERVLQIAVLGMVLLMLAVTVKDVNQFISYLPGRMMDGSVDAVLAIDTAGPEIGVAGVVRNSDPVVWTARVVRGADAVLLPAIARTLEALDRRGASLVGVAVSVGPGAFTGLRVGLSAALGIAVARGVPVYAEGSLAARARLVSTRPVLVLLDARKQRFYGQWFGAAGPMGPAADRPLADWLAEAEGAGVALGEGALVARERLEADGWTIPPSAGVVPVVALAEAALSGRISASDAAGVRLHYVRPPDARKPTHLLTPPGTGSPT